MKTTLPLLSALMSLLLGGCVEPIVIGGAAAGVGAYETKPDDLPPPDMADQMPPHESWCYKTMGEEVECYAEPQDTPPGRLLNVDPPNRYPLTSRAYAETLTQSRLANAPKNVTSDSGIQTLGMTPVQPVQMTPIPPQAAPQPAPAPKAAHKAKKHKKKHRKTKAKPCDCVPATAAPPSTPTPPITP